MKVIEKTYTGLKWIAFILYVVVVLGVWKQAPSYLHIVESVFSLVIAVNCFLKLLNGLYRGL